jgi:hypothetical protein
VGAPSATAAAARQGSHRPRADGKRDRAATVAASLHVLTLCGAGENPSGSKIAARRNRFRS